MLPTTNSLTERRYPITVVCALIIQDGKVLLERHAPREAGEGHLWDIPGGKVEIGETPADAVRREILEEMGVRIIIQRSLSRLDSSSWGDNHWLLFTYECSIESGDPPLSDDLAWIEIDRLGYCDVKAPDLDIIEYANSLSPSPWRGVNFSMTDSEIHQWAEEQHRKATESRMMSMKK